MRKLVKAISTHGWFEFDAVTGTVTDSCLGVDFGPIPVAVDVGDWQQFWNADISGAGDIDVLDLALIWADGSRTEAEAEVRRELQNQINQGKRKRSLVPEEPELTDDQIQRLDFVHNSIHDMLCAVAGQELPWDMEFIGQIEDIAQDYICGKLKLMTEMEFSPYFEV